MNHTEKAIMQAFRELLDEYPLNKITVKTIVERCQVNRNTFYYHFQDIPSLIERTLQEMVDQIIRTNCDFGAPMDCIRPMVQYFIDNKRSILHVYDGVRREVFLDYLERASMYTVTRYVESATAELSMRQSDRDLLIRYHKCVMVGIVLDWLDARMNYDLLSACDRITQLLDGSSKQAFLNCAEAQTKDTP